MKKLSVLLGLILVFISVIQPIKASEATTYTVTLDSKGEFIRTQDAYLPEMVNIDMGLNKPEDMMFDDLGVLWIADTGNQRILKFDTTLNQTIDEIHYDAFITPRGLYVTDNALYVADSSAKSVFKFDLNGHHIETYLRPESPSFADTAFAPSKIVVDNRGNMYIYGEGVSNGIIQLSNQGEFLGFFTTNKVQLSITQQFYKMILSQDQFDRLALRSPQTFSSIFIDHNSMIYTSTMNTKISAVKKHNMQGGNMFSNTIGAEDTRDIYVDKQGIIYAGTQTGAIYIYDSYGAFIVSFGVRKGTEKPSEDIKGLFSSLSAIAVRDDGYIFALDEEKSFLQSFRPTAYSTQIYEAIKLYEDRAYTEAIDAWQSVLNLNQMSTLAHNSIAKSYLQLEAYDLAMKHFELAGNKTLYSEAYWEVRNVQIQSVLGVWIIVLIGLYVSTKTLVLIDKKTAMITNTFAPVNKFFDRKILKDIFYFFKVIRRPLDSFYEIKRGNHGSVLAGTIIYILTFILLIVYSSAQGFIFQVSAVEDLDLTAIILGYFLLTGLFMVSNYLDTSLHDGIGNPKQIYLMFTYSLGPIMIAFILNTILSHYLTLNEAFFITSIMNVGVVYTAVLILLGVIETHEYRGKKAFKSILMSLLFTIIMIIVVIIIVTMWRQLYIFMDGIWKELLRNVFN
jgi:tetratricopeptide (TPR) repeat protein